MQTSDASPSARCGVATRTAFGARWRRTSDWAYSRTTPETGFVCEGRSAVWNEPRICSISGMRRSAPTSTAAPWKRKFRESLGGLDVRVRLECKPAPDGFREELSEGGG